MAYSTVRFREHGNVVEFRLRPTFDFVDIVTSLSISYCMPLSYEYENCRSLENQFEFVGGCEVFCEVVVLMLDLNEICVNDLHFTMLGSGVVIPDV